MVHVPLRRALSASSWWGRQDGYGETRSSTLPKGGLGLSKGCLFSSTVNGIGVVGKRREVVDNFMRETGSCGTTRNPYQRLWNIRVDEEE